MTLRPKILLVDDLPANLHMMCEALAENYDLLIATSGIDALLMGRETHPDLILLDIMMPVMDGLETLRRLRDSDWGRDIPVILITADDRPETEVRGLQLGADDFLTKPVSVPAVQARVLHLLSASLLKRTLMALNQSLVRLEGSAFFQSACRLLAESLGADVAFVGRYHANSQSIEVNNGWDGNGPVSPFIYDLAGSPCAEVLRVGVVCYRDQVQQLFPEDLALAKRGIVSYAGCTLFDRQGNPLGILVTLGRNPLPDLACSLTPSMLRVFVDRMASEIQRSEAEHGLRKAMVFLERDAAYRHLIQSLSQSFIDIPLGKLSHAVTASLGQIGAFLSADRAYVFSYDWIRNVTSNTHEWCAQGVVAAQEQLQDIPITQVREWCDLHRKGKPVRINDVALLPEGNLKHNLQRQGVVSLLTVPLMDHGRCLGFVGLDSLSARPNFGSDEEFLLSLVAGLLVTVARRERLEKGLVEQEHHFRTLANGGSALIWTAGVDKKCNYFNEPWLRFTGRTLGQELGDGWAEGVHADDLEHCLAVYHRHFDRHEPFAIEYRLRHADGGYRWIIDQGNPRYDSGERFIGYIGFCYDIESRKQAEAQLQQAASVFQHANEGILITDRGGYILDVNEAFTRITGFERHEVLGRTPRLLKSGRHDARFFSVMWQALLTTGSWFGEIWNCRKNGEIFAELLTISAVRGANGEIERFVGLFSDISMQKEYQQQLEHIAHYDMLTGLPNRALLADRLRTAMAQAQRRDNQIALVMLDLDGFKAVNDTHGHDVGDTLLVEIAVRLKKALREGDTLARLGGDEFVAVLIDLADPAACQNLLRRLLLAASEPVAVGDIWLQVSASIGVSFFPQTDTIDAEQLLRQADQAMYQAKLAGKNRYHTFDAALDRVMRGRHEETERIRKAIHDNELVLHYQPRVNMRKGTVIGVEALLRWQHPDRGLLPPIEFLPLLNGHGLMVEIGEWVIDEAIRQLDVWRVLGLELPVSINVDGLQLAQPRFIELLKASLARYPEVLAKNLELEVLETSALEDLVHVTRVMTDGRALGLRFSLDDFGTGYSSLLYLRKLPVDILKIDRSFVRDMLDDEDDLAILRGVIGLGASFQREVVAEGVESEAHGELLIKLGCELGQGYAIAKPMPAAQVAQWITDWRPSARWTAVGTLNA